MDDLALAAHAKAVLMDLKADLNVSAQDGTILVRTQAPILQSEPLAQQIREMAKKVPGVVDAKIEITASGTEGLG
jgi:hypothetical protein